MTKKAVANMWLNETTEVVGDIKRHRNETETHLLTSSPLQPLVVFILALLQTTLTQTFQVVNLSIYSIFQL